MPLSSSKKSESFRPAQHLRTKAQFDLVFKTGRRANKDWMGMIAAENGLAFPRLGMVIPKAVGTAVARNRARRWIREAFRKNQNDLKRGLDLVILGRKGIAESSAVEVEQRFLEFIRRLRLGGS